MVDGLIPLHRRFSRFGHFAAGTDYRLLPFTFNDLDNERVVAFNLVGEFLVFSKSELHALVNRTSPLPENLRKELVAKGFILVDNQESALDLLALKYRTKKASLGIGPSLHIFVTTLRCDHGCPYCQVSRVTPDRSKYDMSERTADLAIDAMFQSNSSVLKVEFQGGESLLNVELMRYVVRQVKLKNEVHRKDIQFVVATNLSQITDEILEFLNTNEILVSTSLDGPSHLHNRNRPRPGNNSYELAVSGIERCRQALGFDRVSALMTTTKESLKHPEAIVDEYIRLGFDGIFLRWLSPFGFAVKSAGKIGYSSKDYCDFYQIGLRYILKRNREGLRFREDYASIVLRRILYPFETGYVDLSSPSGIGSQVVVYNYDGEVYASDESRMLAENADFTFRLGNLERDDPKEIFGNENLKRIVYDSMVEGTPGCSDCAYQAVCGSDPVFNHATQGDYVGHRPSSEFCSRQMYVQNLLISILEDEPENAEILRDWATKC